MDSKMAAMNKKKKQLNDYADIIYSNVYHLIIFVDTVFVPSLYALSRP